MDKRNKITIAIGSAVVLASGVYFLNKSENNGTILDDKYQMIVQNESKENDSMTILDVTTKDNKIYTLNTSYYKDNIYELYITLPNGNIISKEFNYSYNHHTSSNVDLNRISPISAILIFIL